MSKMSKRSGLLELDFQEESDNDNSTNEQELKRSVQLQLEKSGMTDVIRKLVKEIYLSKGTSTLISPDDVLKTIYSRGIMNKLVKGIDDQKPSEKGLKSYADDAKGATKRVRVEEDTDTSDISGRVTPTPHNIDFSLSEHAAFASNSKRFYLKVELSKGKAFLDGLSHDEIMQNNNPRKSKLVLHLFYKSQRFSTMPVDCCCDPNFKDSFMIDIGNFPNGSVAHLLAIKEPLKIVIVREDVNLPSSGGSLVISFTLHDWRTVLLTEKAEESLILELMGTGSEHSVTVGLVKITLSMLPPTEELVSEKTYISQLQSEKSEKDAQNRSFLKYCKSWWKEFTEMRLGNDLRDVRLFAYDEQMISRSVVSFVQPLKSDTVLLTPMHAAWFTALLPISQKSTGTRGMMNCCSIDNDSSAAFWQSLHSTIASKKGSVADHAILLCSLLLGFGLNAFVALGSRKEKEPESWAWVVTFDYEQPLFWESTTGNQNKDQKSKRFKHLPLPKEVELPNERTERIRRNLAHRFNSVGCVFNHENFFANIQPSDSVHMIDWDLFVPSKWKCIAKDCLQSIPVNSNPPGLLAAHRDCTIISRNIEERIKDCIIDRRSREDLSTRWDDTLKTFLGQQLATNELECSTGVSSFENFFEVVVMRHIPCGYDFKGFPFHCHFHDGLTIFRSCMADSRCQEIVLCRGDDVQHCLRVMVFAYPENVISVRLMIAAKFISVE